MTAPPSDGANRLDLFAFCPRCGDRSIARHSDKSVNCSGCGLVLFMNVAAAAGAIITNDQNQILLVRRDRDPGKGKLGAPGGFIDAGESVESALAREVKEEVNLVVSSMRYLASFPNRYHYRDICYPTTDMYFVCCVESFHPLQAMDEVHSVLFMDLCNVNPQDIAFPSLFWAIERFRRGV